MGSNSDTRPKYQIVATDLRRAILSQEWPAGSQIPTEESLARQYGVSRGTIRQALDQLTQEGLLSREQGRGTFVNPLPGNTRLSLTSFNVAMQRQGLIPSTRLLDGSIQKADETIARKLHLRPGTPVIRIERLRLANGEPISREVRWLSQALCPNLLQEDLEHESIHDLLLHKFRLPLTRMHHTVTVVSASQDDAELLGVPAGSTLFAVARLTYTSEDTPAVYYQAVFRTDQYHFVFEVHVDREATSFH